MIYMDTPGLSTKEAKLFGRKFGHNIRKFRAAPIYTRVGRPEYTSVLTFVLLTVSSWYSIDLIMLSTILTACIIGGAFRLVAFYNFALGWVKSFRRSVTVYPVIRDSQMKYIYGKDIVVGDTVVLRTGYIVPADGALLDGSLEVDQSYITQDEGLSDKVPGYADLKDPTCPHVLLRGSIIKAGIGYMEVMDTTSIHDGDHMYRCSAIQVPPLAVNSIKAMHIMPMSVGAFILWMACTSTIALDMHMPMISWLNTTWYAAIYGILIYMATRYDIINVAVLYAHLYRASKHGITFTSATAIEKLADVNTVVVDDRFMTVKSDYQCDKIFFSTIAGMDSTEEPIAIPYGLRKMLDFTIKETTQVLTDGDNYIGQDDIENIIDGAISPNNARISEEADEIYMEYPVTSRRKFTAVSLMHPDHGDITVFRGSAQTILPKCSMALLDDGEDAMALEGDKKAVFSTLYECSANSECLEVFAMSEMVETDLDDLEELPDDLQFIGAVSIRCKETYNGDVSVFESLGSRFTMMGSDVASSTARGLSAIGSKVCLCSADNNVSDQHIVTVGVKDHESSSRPVDVLIDSYSNLPVKIYNAVVDSKKWKRAVAGAFHARNTFIILTLTLISWQAISSTFLGLMYGVSVDSGFLGTMMPVVLAFYVVYTLAVPIITAGIECASVDDPDEKELCSAYSIVLALPFLACMPIDMYANGSTNMLYYVAAVLTAPLVNMPYLELSVWTRVTIVLSLFAPIVALKYLM